MDKTLLSILLSVGGIIVGIVIMLLINYFKGSNANKKADSILEKARKEAEKSKRDTILEAKEEIHRLKMDAEREVKEVREEQKVSEPSQKTSARISDEEVEHIAKSSLFSRIVAKVKNIKDNIKEKVLSDETEEEPVIEENVEKQPTKPVENTATVDEERDNNLARSGLLSRILAKKNQINETVVPSLFFSHSTNAMPARPASAADSPPPSPCRRLSR